MTERDRNWEWGDYIVKKRGGILYVAVVGAAGDWEAYQGNPAWGVMATKCGGGGLILDWEAEVIFPELAHLHYRS